MDGLHVLTVAVIFVNFHSKGTESRPKRSLLPDNIYKTQYAPDISNIIDRPKRGFETEFRPKLTNNLRDFVRRPKRSTYRHETISNDIVSREPSNKIGDLIKRPKRSINEHETISNDKVSKELINSIRELITRPKRSDYKHETIQNEISSDEISRPKRKESVGKGHSNAYNFHERETVESLKSILGGKGIVKQTNKNTARPKYERTFNKFINTIFENLCHKGKRNSEEALSLCLSAERLTKKAWGNPALPPYL